MCILIILWNYSIKNMHYLSKNAHNFSTLILYCIVIYSVEIVSLVGGQIGH